MAYASSSSVPSSTFSHMTSSTTRSTTAPMTSPKVKASGMSGLLFEKFGPDVEPVVRAQVPVLESGSSRDGGHVPSGHSAGSDPLLNALIILGTEDLCSGGNTAEFVDCVPNGRVLIHGSDATQEKLAMQENPVVTQAFLVANLPRMSSIHSRIQALRQHLKLSMQDLGNLVGVSWQTVQQWENGKTAPKRKRLDEVARALNSTPEYLLTGASGTPDESATGDATASVGERDDWWPFTRIGQAELRALSAADRDSLEGAMALTLAQLRMKTAEKDQPASGVTYGRPAFDPDSVENPFPMTPMAPKPWDPAWRPPAEPERVPVPAISTSREVVANVSAGGSAANDEFEPVPELPDVRLAAGDEGIEVLNEAAKGTLHFRSSFLRQHNANDGRARVVYASGDSMEPIIPNGAAMLLVPSDGLTLHDVAGGGVWAINYDGKMLVKTITRPPGGRWVARSFNQAYPDILLENGVAVRVLGRIVWVGAALRDDMQGQWVKR